MKITTQKSYLWAILFSISTYTQASTISVYGAAQGQALKNQQQKNHQYLLQMGSFKNKHYAIEHQAKLTKKTKQPVHLVYNKNAPVPYAVFLGPFNTLTELNQTSQELLTDQPVAQPLPLTSLSKTTQHTSTPAFDTSRSSFLTLNVGPAWSNPGKTQTFFVQPDLESSYINTNTTNILGVGEIFTGFEYILHSKYKGQLGLAFLGTTNVDIKGDVLVDANPNFNNMFYTYNVHHLHAALKGKLISALNPISVLMLQPYISGSVGVGFNKSYKFRMTPKLFEQVVPPSFNSNTVTAFTYTAGIGLQKRINPHWILSLGYDFSDWGKSYLDAANGQTLGRGLTLNHIYVNELQIGFTFQPQTAKS